MKRKKTRPTVEELRLKDACFAIETAFFLIFVVDVLLTLFT